MQLSRRRIEGAQALALHYKPSFMSFNLSNVGEFSGVEFSRTVSELKKKREREREKEGKKEGKKYNPRLVFASSFKRKIR